nr:hypothetical protein [Tanacetum cinerariifolium]
MFDDDQFEDELEMGDDAFVLIGKEVAPNSEILEAMFPLLEEFSDVFHDELPDALPPLCDIQRHIDLEPGSQLPNMPHNRMSPGKHEELRRQFEELKVQDFVEGLPYHGDSFDDDLVGNSRTNFVYPWGNDKGPEAFLNDDHSSDFKTKSSSTSLNSLLEETNNFDNSLPEFTTFSNVLFDAEYESDSSDDQSCSDEDVLEKIISKPLFEEEIIPMKMDQHPDNADSDLMESLRTHDSSLIISSKIDSLFDEFADELALLKSIPPGIDETDCDFEEDIRLIEKLLYDNSSPRPPKEIISANSDDEIESFSPPPILVKDSDSLMEEIDLSCTSVYPMPPGIEDDDYDSERDILILKDLPSIDTLSFPEKESFHFDIPSFSHPPTKPPDEEFAGELTLLKSIPLGIHETDCNFEEDIRLIEKLLYDNSSPRPPEEFVSVNSDAKIKSFSPSPILVKDSDSIIEEIDLFCTSDYPMPSGIKDKDYDSERDILIPKDLPSNNSFTFAEK